MPGDLNDQEQWLPFHHDRHYNPGPNQFEPGAPNLNGYLQGIAAELTGVRLNGDNLLKLKRHLEGKGFLHRHWGDEPFRNEVCKFIKKIVSARKVARAYARSQ